MENVSIYECKDGRLRIYDKTTKKVTSYPKYLVENEIGRKLDSNEEIHHKDGNPLNNDISNLEIRIHGEHQREHSVKYFDKIEICPICEKEFIWTAKQQKYFYSNLSRKNPQNKNPLGKPFCSKHCSGLYSQNFR